VSDDSSDSAGATVTPTERAALADIDEAGRSVLFEGEPKTVRLTLEAGERVPAHQHPGREIVCHVTSGRIEMTLGEETHTLEEGEIARFDGDQDISPAADVDSAAVLVLAES